MASPYKDLPYLNPYLHKAFEQYFSTKVAAWLWGHEHNFVAYRNGIFGLAKGRLVGCSAYEEAESSDPYKVNYPQVPYLDPSEYQLKADEGYYNHGYAVIDLSKRAQPTDPISIEYYQYPSWGATRPPSPQSSQFFSETFARPTPPPPELATYNTSLNLYAEEGLYVGPLYQQTQYYPTLTTDSPVGLEVTGGTGAIRHGDQVSIKTLEGAAGSDNVLGAWSTPTLYYYRPGWDQQIWTIVKRDASDPLIHYGDQVSFVNKSYSGQYLQPYWSKVYGAVYLTTQSGDPYYWSMRPAMQSFEPVPMLDAAAVPG
jgi:hypothetical protein